MIMRTDVPGNELDAVKTQAGPLSISAAGDVSVTVQDEWMILVPRTDGTKQAMIGVTCDKITSTFPKINTKEAFSEIIEKAPNSKKDFLRKLSVPDVVGGDPDLLIGVYYQCIFPEVLHTLPSGLFIAKLKLKSSNGWNAVIGGPHHSFSHQLSVDCGGERTCSSQGLFFDSCTDSKMEKFRRKSEMETFHSNRFNYLAIADEDGELLEKEDDIPSLDAAAAADREHFRVMETKLKKIGTDTSEAKKWISTFNSQMVKLKLDLYRRRKDEIYIRHNNFRDLTDDNNDVNKDMHQDYEVEEEVRCETSQCSTANEDLVKVDRKDGEDEEDQDDLQEDDDNSAAWETQTRRSRRCRDSKQRSRKEQGRF